MLFFYNCKQSLAFYRLFQKNSANANVKFTYLFVLTESITWKCRLGTSTRTDYFYSTSKVEVSKYGYIYIYVYIVFQTKPYVHFSYVCDELIGFYAFCLW